MRIAIIDALEVHPGELMHRRGQSRRRSLSSAPAGAARPLLPTLLRDLAVVMVTSAVCWVVVG